ncbi:phosphate acyltransferase PlsX [Fructilactobacillus fructivorans]|uniref:phosphate acyltransferase PlsX n=1 Tax=Fructilactobacillus fructivorans TaxID=1614 RepID=UPI000B060801|nr:phosphate acyltransferase PlsX [Fructilactobacillus fructivorans]
MIKIAIDAMGGDNAPKEIVKGVELARNEIDNVEFQLFGNSTQINSLLSNKEWIKVIQSDEVIKMEDEPVRAVKDKKNSSLVMAARAVKDGSADAFYSCGNTGAILVAGLLIIGRIKGIDRPGLITTLPVINNDTGFTLIDCGANADAKVVNVYQYALLGKYYAEKVLKINNPRIGLINNGTESDKGNKIHQKMYQALSQNDDINFIGNIESRGLLDGITDVAVTDGFTGNAVLKSIEGTALSMINMLKDGIINGGFGSKMGALLLKDTLKKIAHKMDYTKYGGAVLLGLKAPVVKSHGSSKAKTVRNTVVQIEQIITSNFVGSVKNYFSNHTDEMDDIKKGEQ